MCFSNEMCFFQTRRVSGIANEMCLSPDHQPRQSCEGQAVDQMIADVHKVPESPTDVLTDMHKAPESTKDVEVSKTIYPGGQEARLFNDDDVFSPLRALAGVPTAFVNEGWSLHDLESGGAKGGCLMAFVRSEYIVKELCADDHDSLLEISHSYFEHIHDGDTLLCTILLHFEHLASGRYFFVMRNVTGSGPFLAKYDLKGCDDDKTLEVSGRKITPADTLKPNAGPRSWNFMLTEGQREEVLNRMRRDAEWLTSHQLMDYSLIVAVKTYQGVSSDRCFGQLPLIRRCADGSEVAVCIGIIDFLQKWNLKKRIARRIKFLEMDKATIPPSRYAQRFCEYFERRFVCAKVCKGAQAPSPSILATTHRAESSCISVKAEEKTGSAPITEDAETEEEKIDSKHVELRWLPWF